MLVALCTREPASNSVSQWYAGESDDLVSSVWCVTEFASALGIKRRTRQFDQAGAEAVWRQFERLCANDLRLLPLEPATFHRAALLTLDASSGLRAGDSLHLAAAIDANAIRIATLDAVLAENAKRQGLKLVAL
ncbi:MAG: type II toxin-antitoxin system VapC family toxin [Candidatus Accumulibacter sp.]|nr:type II toxin-antitoxin system VapC family toxin [Accumulibacter sp.]